MGRFAGIAMALGASAMLQAKPPELIPVSATTFQIADGNLLVGTSDGGMSLYEAETGRRLLCAPGDGAAPAKDVQWVAGNPWWCDAGSPVVHALGSDLRTVADIDAGIGPIERLCPWKDSVIAFSSTDFRFIDLKTHAVVAPEKYLPPNIAADAKQGAVCANWKNGHGILLLVRRFGKHKESKPDEVADIALVNAWSDDYKLLGGYTCSLVPFKDTGGPPVRFKVGSSMHEAPSGTASLGNLAVSADGFVALGKGEVVTVPFLKQGWDAQHVSVPVDPAYGQTLFQAESNAWWTDGTKLYRASLENGATDVFLQKARRKSALTSIRVEGGAVWTLSDGGLQRVDSNSFVHFQAGLEAAKPLTVRQKRLAVALGTPAKLTGAGFVQKMLKEAGYPARKSLTQLQPVQEDSLAYGDVVLDSVGAAIYVGGGMVQDGAAPPHPMDLTEDAKIVRPFEDIVLAWKGVGIEPVGLGQPYAPLGNGKFVEITHDTEFDRPYLPLHERMADEMASWVGTPYRWGGNDHDGVDCSGFVCAVFRSVGINLPRYSQDIGTAKLGQVVYDQIRYGDVLVYSWPHKHCAIYVGNGQVMEAISGGVTVRSLSIHPFAIVRRFLTADGQSPSGGTDGGESPSQ